MNLWNKTYCVWTQADADGQYSDMFTGIDLSEWTEEDVKAHADDYIAVALNEIEAYLNERAEELTFPLQGWTTSHVYEDADDYIEQRMQEAKVDLNSEIDDIVAWVKNQQAHSPAEAPSRTPLSKPVVVDRETERNEKTGTVEVEARKLKAGDQIKPYFTQPEVVTVESVTVYTPVGADFQRVFVKFENGEGLAMNLDQVVDFVEPPSEKHAGWSNYETHMLSAQGLNGDYALYTMAALIAKQDQPLSIKAKRLKDTTVSRWERDQARRNHPRFLPAFDSVDQFDQVNWTELMENLIEDIND